MVTWPLKIRLRRSAYNVIAEQVQVRALQLVIEFIYLTQFVRLDRTKKSKPSEDGIGQPFRRQ